MPDRNKPIRVLYINHYGIFGGSQRSILELIAAFPEGSVSSYFLSPRGKGEEIFRSMNIPYTTIPGGLSKFDHTRMGYYKGFRWLILIRELLYAVPTMIVFWRFRKKAREFDLVHINEITCVLPLILAGKWFKKPVLLHARAVFHNDSANKLTAILLRIFDKYASCIVPIDHTVAASIRLPSKLRVVHNSFSRNSRLSASENTFAARLAGIPKRKLNIGFIGAIHTNKGIVELLEAIKICRANDLDVALIVAGNGNAQTRALLRAGMNLLGLNQDKSSILTDFISGNALEDYIHLLGFSTNTNCFFEYIDVLCFPSYYNALGRPVFEAAFFRKPSIVAIENPYPDTFIDGVTGLQIRERDPESLYGAIKKMYDNPSLIIDMGEQAYQLAVTNFNSERNAKKMLAIYESLL